MWQIYSLLMEIELRRDMIDYLATMLVIKILRKLKIPSTPLHRLDEFVYILISIYSMQITGPLGHFFII